MIVWEYHTERIIDSDHHRFRREFHLRSVTGSSRQVQLAEDEEEGRDHQEEAREEQSRAASKAHWSTPQPVEFELPDRLRQLGEAGWELVVGHYVDVGQNPYWKFVFKRPRAKG